MVGTWKPIALLCAVVAGLAALASGAGVFLRWDLATMAVTTARGEHGLTVVRHRTAPWLTGVLGVGMIIWIAVQLVIMPATMFLQWIFLATGFALGFIALFWLRRTGQLRAW